MSVSGRLRALVYENPRAAASYELHDELLALANELDKPAADPSDDELLRLAKKAWPDDVVSRVYYDGSLEINGQDNNGIVVFEMFIPEHPRSRAGAHAALLVLAGEG